MPKSNVRLLPVFDFMKKGILLRGLASALVFSTGFFLLSGCLGPRHFHPRGLVAPTWNEAYARMHPFSGPRKPGTDPSTLNGKVMCGYQGWFLALGDSSGEGWVHFGLHEFIPGNCTVDFWPDMSEAAPDECYPTAFHYPDGSTATIFSSYNARTVNRHFKWMADYGIDGAFLQRFGTTLRTPDGYDHLNAVLDNVREGANDNGRTWAVMYDLSGLEDEEVSTVIMEDWKRLVDQMNVTNDPSYQRHNGKPVVSVWGVGFDEKRKYTLATCARLIDFLKNDPRYGGNCVMLGVPYGWREQNRDAVKDPELHDVILKADIVSPWATTRYKDTEQFIQNMDEYPRGDLAWCRQNNRDYMPVIFPGFRWHNVQKTRGRDGSVDDIPRLKGQFFKDQGTALIASGINMLYIAMFDEIDEGTAIFKCSNTPPVDGSDFGTFEGLPSDTYLRIAGEFSDELKKRK